MCVIGAGGHSKVLIDAILSQYESDIIMVFDKEPSKIGTHILGKEIQDEKLIMAYEANHVCLVNGIGSVNNTKIRREIFIKYKKNKFNFCNIIHNSSVISKYAHLGEGCQLLAGCIIQAGSIIGDNVIVNTKTSIDHDCVIGSHSHLAPGVTLSGGVNIGDSCHIGTGAVVIQGIKIGANSLIAAGSVVVNDIQPNSRVKGVPAK